MSRRKILLITTDQQRYDAYGVNGGTIARTPVVDGLAAAGITYRRCHPQSVVCMPSRSTILTGQHVSTHGVWMNGVPLPIDAPSVAAELSDHGYRTALIGKAHFEPYVDPFGRFAENGFARHGMGAPHRGFDHMELATHGANGTNHYAAWLRSTHPDAVAGYCNPLDAALEVNAATGGDTGAPQIVVNPIERDWYHTDWVADRTIAWLDSLPDDADWFGWMSFPDPHHPWDPPASEVGRVDWRELDLPAGYPESAEERERILDAKPRHWKLWYEGRLVSNYEAPKRWVPATLTADQVREVNALVHVENELIDEAIGRVMTALRRRGWDDDTDVLVTTDHGELQGDFGLLFKGPYHVDGLLRIPLVWRPAPSAVASGEVVLPQRHEVGDPVGLVDLAPTLCAIAGLHTPPWMEGRALPAADGLGAHERVLTEWDSILFGVEVHLRTIATRDVVCTTYLPGTVHDGTEGELYLTDDDPLQRSNHWNDPGTAAERNDLVAELVGSLPPWTPTVRPLEAPV
jgi:arylsulfatase A-like enzyme